MATGFLPGGGNTALDALATAFPWVQLHVGDPGAAGTSNVATETTRKQATFSASSGGATTTTGAATWTNIAGTQDATYLTGHTASTAGTPGWSGTVTMNAYVAGDTVTFATGDIDLSVTLAS